MTLASSNCRRKAPVRRTPGGARHSVALQLSRRHRQQPADTIHLILRSGARYAANVWNAGGARCVRQRTGETQLALCAASSMVKEHPAEQAREHADGRRSPSRHDNVRARRRARYPLAQTTAHADRLSIAPPVPPRRSPSAVSSPGGFRTPASGRARARSLMRRRHPKPFTGGRHRHGPLGRGRARWGGKWGLVLSRWSAARRSRRHCGARAAARAHAARGRAQPYTANDP